MKYSLQPIIIQVAICDIILQDLTFPCGQASPSNSGLCNIRPNSKTPNATADNSRIILIAIATTICILVATIIIYYYRRSKAPPSVPAAVPPMQPLTIVYKNTFRAWYDDTKEAIKKLVEDERYQQFTQGNLQISDERYSKFHEEGQREIIERQNEILGQEQEEEREDGGQYSKEEKKDQ